MKRLSHFPRCAFFRLMLIRLTAARDQEEASGTTSPHSLKSRRNTLLVEGLHIIDSHNSYHFATSSTFVAVIFTWMSSQPSVAGASHLWASLTLKASYGQPLRFHVLRQCPPPIDMQER